MAERTLKAIVKAVAYFQDPVNKQSVVDILMKWLRLPRVEDAVAGYEAMRPIYSRRIFPTVEGVPTPSAFWAAWIPGSAG